MQTLVDLKRLAAVALVATTLVLAVPARSEALGPGGMGGGMGGHAGGFGGGAGFAGHGGFAGHPGFGGHPGFAGHPGFGGPRFAGPPGFVGRPGFYHDGHGRGFVFAGPAFYWWPSYPYDGAPAGYWYYCSSADLYYPYVERCPEPWVEVPPE